MKKQIFIAIGLIGFSQSVFSMSYEEALVNHLYFEHASVSAEYCERNSFPTQAALASWQLKHQTTRREMFRVIQLRMVEGGLNKKEQEVVLAKAVESHRNAAQKHNATKMPNCQRFDLQLKMYSDLMVQ
ncbi:MAG: hypothetical protein WBK51_07995 [Polaromonas sp.]